MTEPSTRLVCDVSAKSGMDWDLWHAVRQRIQP